MALTAKHAQLLKSNRALLLTFESFPVTVKLSAVAIALALGVGGGIQALKGTASDTVQVCIRNKGTLQCADKAGKPYLMTQYHAEQWKANGIPGEVAFLKPTPATNPHKALWMLLFACSFGAAGVGLRSLQNSERQLAGYEAIAEKRDLAKADLTARSELLETYRTVAVGEVRLQGDLEAAATERATVIKQCEVLGEADIKIAEMEASEAVFEAETAGLSEEQKREYMEFLRNQKTPYLLSGTQTLDSVNNPSDKVQQGNSEPIEPAQPIADRLQSVGKEIVENLHHAQLSTMVAAPARTGKTVLLHLYLSNLYAAYPNAQVIIIAQKRDDYMGHLEAGRVVLFDPLDPTDTIAAIDATYKELLRRRELPKEERKSLVPARLVLDDWFASYQILLKTNYWNKIKSQLGFIATVGPEFGVGFFCCTHTANIESVGFVPDASVRANLIVIALGFERPPKFGEFSGDCSMLRIVINNPYLCSESKKLIAELKEFLALPGEQKQPLILCNNQLGLVPYLSPEFPQIRGLNPWSGSFANLVKSRVEPVPPPRSDTFVGTGGNGPLPSLENPGTPYGTRAERLLSVLGKILAGTVETAVFAAESTLEQEEKLELAKLIIEQDLGTEKTIWLLWGIRRGGRNHALYTEARAMLEKLIKGE